MLSITTVIRSFSDACTIRYTHSHVPDVSTASHVLRAEARKIRWPLTSLASGRTKQYVYTTHPHWGTHIPLTTQRLTPLATDLHRANWDLINSYSLYKYIWPQLPSAAPRWKGTALSKCTTVGNGSITRVSLWFCRPTLQKKYNMKSVLC